MIVERFRKTQDNGISVFLLLYGILLTFFVILTSVWYGNGVMMGIKFFLFQAFGILVPGMALICLLKLDFHTDIEWIGFSYFFGICLNLIQYLCIVPLRLQKYALPFMMLVFVASALIIFKSFKSRQYTIQRDYKGEIICSVFSAVMFSIAIFTFAGANLIPPKAEENILLNDTLYWVGNTIELTKEFPPKDFRGYPRAFNYHYFSSLQLAFESLVTGIRPVVISLAYSFFQSMILLIFGAYILFHKCTSKMGYIVIGMLILFFTSGDENGMVVTYMGHMYHGGFGFDYGMGVFLFFLYFVLIQWRSDQFSIKVAVITILTLGINMGMKVPFACIGLCGIGIICIGWLFKKKCKNALITGFPVLIVFILGFIFVVNVIGYGGSLDVLKQPTVIESNGALQILYELYFGALGDSIPHILKSFILSIIYCWHCNATIFSVIMFVFLYSMITRTGWDWLDSACLIMILAGVYVAINIGMVGASNMYFMMSIYPVGIMLLLLHADRIKYGKVWIIPFTVVAYVSFSGFCTGYGQDSMPALIQKGFQNYFSTKDIKYDALDRSYISKNQYEAYDFLRENTSIDTLITTNKEQMIVGVFTERYVIEPGVTNSVFTAANADEQKQAIKDCRQGNIEYIVYDKATSPEFKLLNQDCEEFYHNETTIIYHIL